MVFLKVLKSTKRKEREIRILLLGLDNAGKTTAVKHLNGEPTDTISPTLGFSIKTFEYLGYQLNIWDVGGQKTIRAFWKNYFEETDGLIWVVDSADIARMTDCRNELRCVLKEERLAGASLLVLANKCDLNGSLSMDEIRQSLELNSIKTHHWHIQSCSAIKGQGLVEGISWLVNDIASSIYLLD